MLLTFSEQTSMEVRPKLFISYSHDSDAHKDWVLKLATRLEKNGATVVLDQWDLDIGSDLTRFMESGLIGADRVLAICTSHYVEKTEKPEGGVGYEKMILSAQLMKDLHSTRIIPVVRDNQEGKLPVFLSSKVYIDFRSDADYEPGYAMLIHEIHGRKVKARPAPGPSPFDSQSESLEPAISHRKERYASPALSGTVRFDYSNNDGHYVLGEGSLAFETKWNSGSNDSIIIYNDPESIQSVALVLGSMSIESITDAREYDTSSRHRRPRVGEIVVWKNVAGYYLATKVEAVQARSHGALKDEVTFSYVIQPNKTPSFLVAPQRHVLGPQEPQS